jgi:2-iminobutanoate/2-iminopropanoate deaminase
MNMRVTLRNTADYPGFNEAFRDYFGGDKTTRTCFGSTPNRACVDVQIDYTAMFD